MEEQLLDFKVYTIAELKKELGRRYAVKIHAQVPKDKDISYQRAFKALNGRAVDLEVLKTVMSAVPVAIAAEKALTQANKIITSAAA